MLSHDGMVRGVTLDLYWLGTRWSVKYSVFSVIFQKCVIYFDVCNAKEVIYPLESKTEDGLLSALNIIECDLH